MMNILANILQETLTVKAEGPLVAGSVEVVTCEAVFDGSWEGMTKVLVFSLYEPDRTLPPSQGSVTWLAQRSVTCGDTPVTVPWEVLTRPGMLYISAVGLSGDAVRPTVRQACLPVLPNGGMPGETGQEPSPELWQQAIQEAEAAAERAWQAVAAVETSAETFLQELELDLVPQIGENGNWYFRGEDTGKPACGADGVDGRDGRDGTTPVKGVDYFTQAEQAAMVAEVLESLPVYAGEVV